MGRNVQLREKILTATDGVCENLIDMSLMFIFFGLDLGFRPKNARSVYEASRTAQKSLYDFNYRAIKKAIYRAREKGWIRPGELKLTNEGRARVSGKLPGKRKIPSWDGKWHIALFDIPEKQRGKRDAFREFLKQLGFGKLFESAWISPLPLLGEAHKFVKSNDLDLEVVFSISDKVGVKGSRELANRVWNLEEINREYKEFIRSNDSPSKLIFKYFSIARKDPGLPQDLLPIDWKGQTAFEFYQELANQKYLSK